MRESCFQLSFFIYTRAHWETQKYFTNRSMSSCLFPQSGCFSSQSNKPVQHSYVDVSALKTNTHTPYTHYSLFRQPNTLKQDKHEGPAPQCCSYPSHAHIHRPPNADGSSTDTNWVFLLGPGGLEEIGPPKRKSVFLVLSDKNHFFSGSSSSDCFSKVGKKMLNWEEILDKRNADPSGRMTQKFCF